LIAANKPATNNVTTPKAKKALFPNICARRTLMLAISSMQLAVSGSV
jgi:hypothetical protein